MFKSPTSAKLQEIGPRFTLKLRWLRKGLPAVGAADGVAPTNAGESDEEVDDEADDGEIGDEAMNDEMEVDPRDDGEGDVDEAEQKEENKRKKGVGKAKGGQTIPALDEQQEYEWKWKVSCLLEETCPVPAPVGMLITAGTAHHTPMTAKDGGLQEDFLPMMSNACNPLVRAVAVIFISRCCWSTSLCPGSWAPW
jgi:hypothetical protein